ncbi:putative serpin E3 [Sinocyclocheilus anshuiensis]|uniref:putative serpin E3 n=1 Tax=Sinocyclocheilus anshuiensis TaxID=1608454 RepID=UPI0007B8D9EA|nr:PREDICTED: probable serpin E3 [Sinocyclocheilus anshuiensis]
MHQLSVTSLILCLWLLERCHGNSSLGNSLNDLHTQFGVSLYQTLTETENNSNLIVSAASVSLCLGLLQLGARGNTLAQLEGTLGYDVNDARVQDILSRPQGDLGNSSEGVRLLFKMQSRFNLKPVLQSLGISDVFSPSAADFRGISDGEGLFVSEAFHEVRIEVTEQGTKAASATAMVLLKRSRSAVFKADRPFLFILRQISTGSLLFIGRVLNPAEMS